MAGLLSPYIPDSSEWFKSAAQGYALGDTMRNRDLKVDAGGMAAEGDLKGAKSTLYEGGDFEGANQVHQLMRQASDDALKKVERFHSSMGNLALFADTPEKWDTVIKSAEGIGLDVSKYRNFNTRQMVLAQSGKTIEAINMEAERRKAEAAAAKPIEINGRLVVPQAGGTYKEVYSSPPKPEGLRDVAPGATVYDPAKGPVFTAPAKPAEKKYEFTKYGVGDPTTGEVKPYASGNADPELTLEQSKHEQALRKEYTTLSSDMRTIQDSVGKLRTAQKLDSGQGDIAMVYAYMKMLDPTSVVREGEYATAENTSGVPEKIMNMYNKVLTGTRLTPAMRGQFVTAGEALAGEKTERFGKLKSQFEGIARKSGADPNRIMLDEGMAGSNAPSPATGEAAPKLPAPGAIDGGYRFKGGNPGVPDSWEKIR